MAGGVVVQSLSHVRLFVTPWTAARQASLCFTVSQSLLKLTSIESVMPCNPLVLCHPLRLLPSIFPSITVFSNDSALHIRCPKYLQLQLRHGTCTCNKLTFQDNCLNLTTQSVVPRPAVASVSYGSLLDMWTLRPHRQPAPSESASQQCLPQVLQCGSLRSTCVRAFRVQRSQTFQPHQ